MNTQLKNSNGFTLVETLVAIGVLLLAIIGPMTVAQKGIQNAQYASEQITAVFLAQEEIERIREARDNKALDAYDNTNSGNTTIIGTGNWSTTNACSSGCQLYIDSNTGKYTTVNTGNTSIFTRKVTIGNAINGGIPVTVDVSWQGKVFNGATRHAVLQMWIYDHYERYDN